MKHSRAGEKIVPFRFLVEQRRHWQQEKIVTTNGCFDLLHAGHILLLEAAKNLGDVLIIALNNDQSVRNLKGADRPIKPEKERALILAALEAVDYVFLFGRATPTSYLLKLKPSFHVKGGDYAREDLPERKALEDLGTKVVIGPYLQKKSTTALLHKIKQKKIRSHGV